MEPKNQQKVILTFLEPRIDKKLLSRIKFWHVFCDSMSIMGEHLTFVSFQRKVSRDNPKGHNKQDATCHCCKSPIINIVTLSDGNEYGIDCALNLQGLTDVVRKEIRESSKDRKYKYFICYYVPAFEQYHGHTWVTDISEDRAIAKFAKRMGRDIVNVKVLRTVEK